MKFSPGYSYPLMNIAKNYGANYEDVLLYADSLRDKSYENDDHEMDATSHLIGHLSGDIPTMEECNDHCAEVMSRLTAPPPCN